MTRTDRPSLTPAVKRGPPHRRDINALSDREAMGLPPRYVPPRVAPSAGTIDGLRAQPLSALVALMQSAAEEIAVRIAASSVVSALGDPRINVSEPVMLDVPPARALIGLSSDRIDETWQRYSEFGVRRNWIEKECPQFSAEVSGFRIAKYAVTNGEFAVFLTETGYPQLPTSWAFGKVPDGHANHPVYTVTPEMADAYVQWLGVRTRRSFRLPTELEWEYAAAGTAGLEFPWGAEFVERRANTMELGLLDTTAVGILPEGNSHCGACDMAGNVEEYVATSYSPYPGGTIVHDDLFRLLGHYRIARGGAFNRFRDLARCQRRHGPYPKSLYAIGFRIAESI